ncbi:hypothetical protein NDU88_000830 [Pleurodeles waltl]|uniref:Uncharacterized protein n=1 Tax=Pleurodeles waltl TaxID=8319 RepID=A0AAV7LVU9_PLEWA|nr:hypothetical protein NDU88_000830 [Pleurodeles waltl]
MAQYEHGSTRAHALDGIWEIKTEGEIENLDQECGEDKGTEKKEQSSFMRGSFGEERWKECKKKGKAEEREEEEAGLSGKHINNAAVREQGRARRNAALGAEPAEGCTEPPVHGKPPRSTRGSPGAADVTRSKRAPGGGP